MGLIKHGIGEILPDDDEELQKKGHKLWTAEDQAALDAEHAKADEE